MNDPPKLVHRSIETSGWRKGKKVKTNKAISTYGKGKVQEYVRKMMSDESRILYADKKRSHLVCGGPELQLLDSRNYDFSDNISDFMEDVNSRRFSTKVVEPVQPMSGAWSRGASFADVKAKHPTLFVE